FLPANDRGEQQKTRALGQGMDAGDDLLARLGSDRPTALRAVSLPDARVQHAQIVVDLRDGADGGARVLAGRLLLDADGGREAGQIIDVRLLKLAEKLPRVRRQRLDVPALAFGVERIEGERALARAADAGADDQAVAG